MHSRRISFFFDDDHLTRMKALKERENKKWRREKKRHSSYRYTGW
jgi:hypothetical protein